MLAKVRLGCLPIRLETGRYSIPRLTEASRTCLLCEGLQADVGQLVHVAAPPGPGEVREAEQEVHGPIESEEHFLFHCIAYEKDRAQWFRKLNLPPNFNTLDLGKQLDLVLNDPENVKFTSNFILTAFNLRNNILNKK